MRLKKHEISRITGIPSRRILEWTQKEYLIPSEYNPGKGKISYYSPSDAVWALLLGSLFKMGISAARFVKIFEESDAPIGIEDVMEELDPFDKKPKAEALIIVNDFEDIILGDYEDVRNYRTAITINLDMLRKEIRKALS